MTITRTHSRRFARGAAALVIGLLAPSIALAVGQGRIHGKVLDEDGNPLAGVTITVTTPQLTTLELETTTDDKGRYAFTLKDATLTYDYRLEKEGYPALVVTKKIGINSNVEFDFTLPSAAAAAAEAKAAAAGTATGVFNEGATAAQAGDYATALTKFREAVELEPTLAPGWAALAAIYLDQGKFAEAGAAADKAVELAPNDPRHQRYRYEAWRQAGDAAKAAEAKEALAKLDPSSMVIPLVNQGVEAFNAGDIPKATSFLEEAVGIDDTNIKALFTLGLCYVNAGDTVKAKETFEKYIALAPADDPDMTTAKEMLAYL